MEWDIFNDYNKVLYFHDYGFLYEATMVSIIVIVDGLLYL